MKAADLFDLTGEVAFVTGASSGLGARFARVLAANGAKVICVARRKERLDALVAEIKKDGGQAIAAEADVGDEGQVRAAFDAAEKAFGTVTICVNNAGVSFPARLIETDLAEWRKTMLINLDAVQIVGAQAAQRLVAAKASGTIINIASILGLGVGRGVGAYAVAKAAVIQLTKSMAIEWGFRGVRVNAIAPGYFSTELNSEFLAGPGADMARQVPLGRFGKEGELDGIILLLASRHAASYINGATYVVDGGHRIGLKGL